MGPKSKTKRVKEFNHKFYHLFFSFYHHYVALESPSLVYFFPPILRLGPFSTSNLFKMGLLIISSWFIIGALALLCSNHCKAGRSVFNTMLRCSHNSRKWSDCTRSLKTSTKNQTIRQGFLYTAKNHTCSLF